MSEHRDEPLPLYLVRHRGPLAVNDNEAIASRRIAGYEGGPLVETLVETTTQRAESLARMVNVLSIHPAPSGRFVGDEGHVVVVHPGGAWHREPAGDGAGANA